MLIPSGKCLFRSIPLHGRNKGKLSLSVPAKKELVPERGKVQFLFEHYWLSLSDIEPKHKLQFFLVLHDHQSLIYLL